jgi:hypothetical protein
MLMNLLNSQPLAPGGVFLAGHTTASHIIISDVEKYLYILFAQGDTLYSIKDTGFTHSITTAFDPLSECGDEVLICGGYDASIRVFSLLTGRIAFSINQVPWKLLC